MVRPSPPSMCRDLRDLLSSYLRNLHVVCSSQCTFFGRTRRAFGAAGKRKRCCEALHAICYHF